MAHIKEPEGIDFLIKSPPLTDKERKEISEQIKKMKTKTPRKKIIRKRNTNKELLKKIREERPNQVINKVYSYKKNEHGFYDVLVDMEGHFFETKVLHVTETLPYPFSEYEKLNSRDRKIWNLDNI